MKEFFINFKEDLRESFIDFLPVFPLFLCIIILLSFVLFIAYDCNVKLIDTNEMYKKIITKEFNRDFDNYNEYLLYKIEVLKFEN